MSKPLVKPAISDLHGGVPMTLPKNDTLKVVQNGITTPRKDQGRPKTFDDAIAAQICDDLMAGMALSQSIKALGINNNVFARWLSYETFREKYLAARVMSAELMSSEIIQIADDASKDSFIDPETGKRVSDHTSVNRARLRVSARQWYLSKVLPKVYGDKVALTDSDGDNLRVDISWLRSRSIGKPEDIEFNTIDEPMDDSRLIAGEVLTK